MQNKLLPHFLVIGSGIAGLSYALRMAQHGDVTIITKKHSAESNTNYAQGGIAAVMHPADSFAQHVEDTLIAGAGICDPDIVKLVVEEGPDCVRELVELGTRFTATELSESALHLELEGGHSAHRIVHAADATGREIERSLLAQVQASPRITVLEYHYCLELQVEGGECIGVRVVDERDGSTQTLAATTTLLASGGAGQVYAHTTNPAIATGDGVAMAYRAGAKVANMEFFQFHPTSLYLKEQTPLPLGEVGEGTEPGEGNALKTPSPDSLCSSTSPKGRGISGVSFLISEAVRGAGGVLRNLGGERFMLAYHPSAELAPRDVVARAIDDQLKQRGEDYVWLDISHKPAETIKQHFPTIYETCLKHGIDITRQPIPVVPAAHYQCGGVVTNARAETTIPRLLACGEVAYTGLHGANRLASNSLLEALVFSRKAAEVSVNALGLPPPTPHLAPRFAPRLARLEVPLEAIFVLRQRLRQLMWQKVGIVRSNAWLAEALDALEEIKHQVDPLYVQHPCAVEVNELRNLLEVALLITRSALRRQESRGLHYLLDAPQPRPRYAKPTMV